VATAREDHTEAPLIGTDEVRAQLEWVRQAVEAGSDEEREAALAGGLLDFGPRFCHTLAFLADQEKQAGTGDGRYAPLLEETTDLFLAWLAGRKLSEKVDEPERRAYAARLTLAEGGAGLERIAAKAVLELPDGHPDRDVDGSRDALLRALDRARAEGDADGLALAAETLLDEELLPEEGSVELLEEVLARLNEVEEPSIRNDFRLSVIGYYSVRAIDSRDGGDSAGQRAWSKRAHPILDALTKEVEDDPANSTGRLLAAALSLAASDDDAAAADTFGQVVDSPDAGGDPDLLAAMHETRIRLRLGQDARVTEVLGPRLPAFAELYLTALTDEDVADAGSNFADVLQSAMVANARQGRWGAAVRVLELGKSLRFRHRAELRRTSAGRRLLKLEGGLYTLSRKGQADVRGKSLARDFLGTTTTPEARLLEAYRTALPETPGELLEGPSVEAIAGCLRSGEIAVLLGVARQGTLTAVVTPEDRDSPGKALFESSWPLTRWLELFGSEEEPSWAFALADDEGQIDDRAALERLLAGVDDALSPLGEIIEELDPQRVVLVPHGLLHLVPFQATAPLRERDLLMAPSIALLVDARSRRRPPGIRRGLVIANPTLDLPAASAEAAAVHRWVAPKVTSVAELDGADATRAALMAALGEEVGVLHFCGHGDSDLTEPARSGLRLQPGDELPRGEDDPFARWASGVEGWDEDEFGETRWGDLPGLGRLTEVRGAGDEPARRLLEYSSGATLEGVYRDGRLTGVADVWTAGDVMVQAPFHRCQLVLLSACEVGTGSLGLDIDEHAGLPAALQLAGARSVVATLWPVSDALTALQVDLFYELMAASEGAVIDLAAIIRQLGEQVRTMGIDEAQSRLDRLRAGSDDPLARITLEAYGAGLPERGPRPFQHPYDWATFHVVGAGEATWRKNGAGSRSTARAGAR
jgi:CHAT domain-containing protein